MIFVDFKYFTYARIPHSTLRSQDKLPVHTLGLELVLAHLYYTQGLWITPNLSG